MAEGGGDDADAFAESSEIEDENAVDCSQLNSYGREQIAVISDDIFAEPDLCIPSKKEKPRLPAVDDGLGDKLKREENPFSFKQFLKKDNSPTLVAHSGTSNASKCKNIVRDGDGSRCLEQCTVPTGYSTGLPDFVQDHFISSEHHMHNDCEQGHCVRSPRLDVDNLPDFTLNNNSHVVAQTHIPNEASTSTIQEAGPPKKAAKVQNHQVFDSKCKTKKHHQGGASSSEGAISNSLPDFLSDGPMLSNHEYGAMAKSNLVMAQTSKHLFQNDGGSIDGNSTGCTFEQLKAENTLLSQQLSDTRELLLSESKRVLRMQEELELCRKKEADETAALEKMVQQVEANLQNSTQRAAIAESAVVKLKHEIKLLQAQLTSLAAENAALSGGENCVDNVKEKAKMASDQITSAAASAEQTLRQLLSGVESLKIIAACLANIDKISEDRRPSENEKL